MNQTAIPTVDIVVPVLNEAATLEHSITRLHAKLQQEPSFAGRIIIADNGSTDGTFQIATRLSATLSHVLVQHREVAGRGGALRNAWMVSSADVVAYMDADLSTDLCHLAPLVHCITSGEADVAAGSRLIPGSRVQRSARREVLSRSYNALLRFTLQVPARDAQCGFKAVRGTVAKQLLPSVLDDAWFFDTELLVQAFRHGYTVAEVPVTWTEDRDSRVRIVRTALADLRGIARMMRTSMKPFLSYDAIAVSATLPTVTASAGAGRPV